jgi:hypothetical protein
VSWALSVAKLGQHVRVADFAAGDFDGADFQRLLFASEEYLAPDQAPGPAMFKCVPLALALALDPGCVDQQS